jgi:cytochrome c oxidase assembly factor CtaG
MLKIAQIVVVAAMAVAYALRTRHLAKQGHPIARIRLVSVATGLVVLLTTMLLLAQPGRETLYWRTVERLLSGDLAGLLIAIGLTAPLFAPLERTPLRHLRPLARPQVALALWVANLLVWQWPSIFDATLRHDSLALIEDLLLIAASLNMWKALLDAHVTVPAHMSAHGSIAYILIARLAGIALACVAIWSPDVYYPYYLRIDTASSISPLADQGIAGAIMLAEMALVAIGALLWVSARLGGQLEAVPAQPAAAAPAAEPAAEAEPAAATGSTLAMDAKA